MISNHGQTHFPAPLSSYFFTLSFFFFRRQRFSASDIQTEDVPLVRFSVSFPVKPPPLYLTLRVLIPQKFRRRDSKTHRYSLPVSKGYPTLSFSLHRTKKKVFISSVLLVQGEPGHLYALDLSAHGRRPQGMAAYLARSSRSAVIEVSVFCTILF